MSYKIVRIFPPCLLIACIAIMAALPAQAGQLFRWTDADGRTHYSDHIPPQYVPQGYKIISKQGITVVTISPISDEPPPPPKKPQLTNRDEDLLANYSNENEIIATRQRQLSDIDAHIELAREVIENLERQYRTLAQEAGNHERRSETVPETLRSDIAATQRKIAGQQALIENYTASRQHTQKRYQEDLERYQALTQ